MPSRKQRRRRQKERRHDYEYVYVDGEGHEVEVERAPAAEPVKAQDRKASPPAARRPGRAVPPPSWARVRRRALIVGPIMFLTLAVLGRSNDVPPLALAVQTIVLLAFFLPFSYFMDRFTYRMYLRRGGTPAGEARRR